MSYSNEAIQAFLTRAGMDDTDQMFNEVFDRLSNDEDLDAEGLVTIYEPFISELLAEYQEEVRAWIRGMTLLPGM